MQCLQWWDMTFKEKVWNSVPPKKVPFFRLGKLEKRAVRKTEEFKEEGPGGDYCPNWVENQTRLYLDEKDKKRVKKEAEALAAVAAASHQAAAAQQGQSELQPKLEPKAELDLEIVPEPKAWLDLEPEVKVEPDL
jgi:hypothetical protein